MEKEYLSLISLAKIYFYLEEKEDLEGIKKKYSSILRNMKRFNIQGIKRDNKTFFSKEETLLLCSNGLKEAKALRGLSFEEIKALEEKAYSFYEKEEKDIPSQWHKKLEKDILEVIEKQEPITPFLRSYSQELVIRIKNLTPYTAISVIGNHRKLLNEMTLREFPKKEEKLREKESGSYSFNIREALSFFKIPSELMNYKKSQGIKKVKEKNRDLKPLPFSKEEVREVIQKLLSSDNILDKTLGFMLATGRRTIEVLEKGDFSLSEKDSYLSMKGVAKKKEDGVRIKFPVLYKEDTLLEVIKELREENISHMDLYNYCVKNYKDTFPSLHSLRRLYGAYSYLLFSSPSHNFNLWLSEVLGHEEEDLLTSFSYSLYQV